MKTATMAAWSMLALLLAGAFHQASAGRQVLPYTLPALAGTPTWAPAASYSTSRIVVTAPPIMAIPAAASSSSFSSSSFPSSYSSVTSSNMRKSGTDSDANQPFLDHTKRFIDTNGQHIQTAGLSAPVGGGHNTPRPQQASGSVIAASWGQPSFPNSAFRPLSSFMNSVDQEIPRLPVMKPLVFNPLEPMPLPQMPAWSQQQPQSTPQTPQLPQMPPPQLRQPQPQPHLQLPTPQLQLPQPLAVLDIPGQMQRFAVAASEGNLVKAILDAGDFVKNSITNVTAAADSIIAATNDIIESLPKNITIPNEVERLINNTVGAVNATAASSFWRNLPKIGTPQLPPFNMPKFPGVDNLQFPRLPGVNVATAPALSGNTFSPVATASVPANTRQSNYNWQQQDVPAWVTAAMGTTSSGNANAVSSAISATSATNSRSRQHHTSRSANRRNGDDLYVTAADLLDGSPSVTSAGAAYDNADSAVADAVAVRKQSRRSATGAADPWIGAVSSSGTALNQNSLDTTTKVTRIIPATRVPTPGRFVAVSYDTAADGSTTAAAAAAAIVSQQQVTAAARRSHIPAAATAAVADDDTVAAPESEQLKASRQLKPSTNESQAVQTKPAPIAAPAARPGQNAAAGHSAASTGNISRGPAAVPAVDASNKAGTPAAVTAIAPTSAVNISLAVSVPAATNQPKAAAAAGREALTGEPVTRGASGDDFKTLASISNTAVTAAASKTSSGNVAAAHVAPAQATVALAGNIDNTVAVAAAASADTTVTSTNRNNHTTAAVAINSDALQAPGSAVGVNTSTGSDIKRVTSVPPATSAPQQPAGSAMVPAGKVPTEGLAAAAASVHTALESVDVSAADSKRVALVAKNSSTTASASAAVGY